MILIRIRNLTASIAVLNPPSPPPGMPGPVAVPLSPAGPDSRAPAGAVPRWPRALALVAALHAAVLGLLLPDNPAVPRVTEVPGLLVVSVEPAAPAQAPVPVAVAPRRVPEPPAAHTAAATPTATATAAVTTAPADVPPTPAADTPAMPATPPEALPAAAPAASAAPPPPPDAGRVPGTRATTTYFGQLAGWLNRHKRYPTAARKAKQQGVVTVNFTIDRRGALLDARIERSSGHALLDEAALALLQRAAPMPRLPDALGLQTLTVSLPVDYSLITQ